MTKVIFQDKILFPEIFWKRPVHFYKAQGGKVLVLAGSSGIAGAAILTCEAVFRSGTGILILGFPEKIKEFYKEVLPEAMTMALPSTYSGSLAKKAEGQIIEEAKSCTVAIIGPGLSTNSETIHLIWQLIFELEIPIILDADGINAFAQGIAVMRAKENEEFMKDYLNKIKAPLIITANASEAEKLIRATNMSSLKKFNAKYIKSHKKDVAEKVTKELGIYVVLKGHDTVIASPDERIIINKVSGPKLAAGGDEVLSGIIGSFVAQNPDEICEATASAVYLHSKAGEISLEASSDSSVTASDIIKNLPEAIREAEKE